MQLIHIGQKPEVCTNPSNLNPAVAGFKLTYHADNLKLLYYGETYAN